MKVKIKKAAPAPKFKISPENARVLLMERVTNDVKFIQENVHHSYDGDYIKVSAAMDFLYELYAEPWHQIIVFGHVTRAGSSSADSDIDDWLLTPAKKSSDVEYVWDAQVKSEGGKLNNLLSGWFLHYASCKDDDSREMCLILRKGKESYHRIEHRLPSGSAIDWLMKDIKTRMESCDAKVNANDYVPLAWLKEVIFKLYEES